MQKRYKAAYSGKRPLVDTTRTRLSFRLRQTSVAVDTGLLSSPFDSMLIHSRAPVRVQALIHMPIDAILGRNAKEVFIFSDVEATVGGATMNHEL